MASLKIELLEAKLTCNLDVATKMEPYVIIRTPFQEYRSKTNAAGGKFPIWTNEVYAVQERELGTDIQIICMEEDSLSALEIGSANINMSEFQQGTGVDKWIEIFMNGKSLGNIRFKSTYSLLADSEKIK
jgi:hypothetical protein